MQLFMIFTQNIRSKILAHIELFPEYQILSIRLKLLN